MCLKQPFSLLLAAALTACSAIYAQIDPIDKGHSAHGAAFDIGPRQKPWLMEGIGIAPFPITTRNPEVQQWFNQGNALLHSFWFYEAERSFRWCLKLEPDNAMAYWGLARATEGDRAADFLREAVKRKDKVTERERLYIEAEEAVLLPDPVRDTASKPDYRELRRAEMKKLETLCVKYPDDMEARALLAEVTMGDSRYGAELIIREILARQPNHPGAHHYRIHNWDYNEPEQALVSCRAYTDLVPAIGHAQHMPGHIYAIVGMWHEAALSMDAATRVEKQYMRTSLTFPFNNWNYAHNRTYLSYIQEQLGMAEAAIFGAHQLIDAPLDPVDNKENEFSTHSRGIAAMQLGLIKFERWDDLLNPKFIPWRDVYEDKMNKAYSEARAWLGKGDLEKAGKSIAEHVALKKDLDKNKDAEEAYTIESVELKGRLAMRAATPLWASACLRTPPHANTTCRRDMPTRRSIHSRFTTVWARLTWTPKVRCWRRKPSRRRWSLRATTSSPSPDWCARNVASNADAGQKVLERAKATGITAAPRDSSPAPQRNYARVPLDHFGPPRWEPYEAPALDVHDAAGKPVSLAEYRGKNVLLVFYLGPECPHCLRQLHDIGKNKDEWDRLNTVVLAVSSAAPEKNSEALKQFGDLPARLLSDRDHANARRFHSYDDFEDIELHSTILIDKKGRVYWARFGGDPFSDMSFLVKQVERMNELVGQPILAAAGF
jgi:peroxiredoxin